MKGAPKKKLMTSIEEIPLDSPIEEKIAWAMCRYREMRDLLNKDKRIVVLLTELKDAIYESREAMAQSGVIDACKECEENDGLRMMLFLSEKGKAEYSSFVEQPMYIDDPWERER